MADGCKLQLGLVIVIIRMKMLVHCFCRWLVWWSLSSLTQLQKNFCELYRSVNIRTVNYPTPDSIGDGLLFSLDFFVYFFVCFFVSLSVRLREYGWTNLHEVFREAVEWPWDDLITFWVKSEKPRDVATRGRGLLCFTPQLVKFWGYFAK